MRRNFVICSILATLMILTPLFYMKSADETVGDATETTVRSDDFISVMKTENGSVEKIDTREYLIGALAAEMDMTYHDEALKAQTIACYTYSLYVRDNASNGKYDGADITDDPAVHQGYLTQGERKEKWDKNFDKYEEIAEKTVDAVYGQAIYYEGKPILAVYHDLNSGRTQSSLTVWKKDLSYLSEVESPGDKLSVDYSKKYEFSYSDFEEKITKIDGITIDGDETDWIGKVDKIDSGYIKSVEVCDNEISSQDFRTALNLRSCCFDIESDDEKIYIETYGNGHCVGMSQYGADYMARQGADYREILTHYYQGTEIL